MKHLADALRRDAKRGQFFLRLMILIHACANAKERCNVRVGGDTDFHGALKMFAAATALMKGKLGVLRLQISHPLA